MALGFLSLDLVTKAESAVTKAEWVSVPEGLEFADPGLSSGHADAMRSASARVAG